jgi:hypothetical protein
MAIGCYTFPLYRYCGSENVATCIFCQPISKECWIVSDEAEIGCTTIITAMLGLCNKSCMSRHLPPLILNHKISGLISKLRLYKEFFLELLYSGAFRSSVFGGIILNLEEYKEVYGLIFIRYK